jgi:membrane fusion protein (multidrug efflux system)
MANTDDRPSEKNEPRAVPAVLAHPEGREGTSPSQHDDRTTRLDHHAPAGETVPPADAPPAPPKGHSWFHLVLYLVLAVGVGFGIRFAIPWVKTAFNTESTDDAYVNGKVTFVAARVPGQVMKVFVDDNYRVKKGDLLVQLDKVPYQVQVDIKKAAVLAAERDLVAANAQVRAQLGQARANRFKLEHAIEDVNNSVANLRAAVAALESKKATLELAKSNLKRGEELAPKGISKEELDQRRQTVKVDEAMVDQALQAVYAIRVSLGLPAQPEKGHDLTEVPKNLDQNFSTVRQALGELIQSAAQFGYFPTRWDATPKETIEAFYKQDPDGNLDRIFARIIPEAPNIKQAEARLKQTQADLAQAELNLSYCDVISEIDGVVTRCTVYPGNNVQVGQSLMAVRSLTAIWIDANFKETQLSEMRIGHRVRCEVDMYGSKKEFEGRITGFTMGTGQTLALLPPQNATGNFVKIVQRLPVRIELTNYNPDKDPLFIGTSVTPYVYYKEPPTGPNAGDYLQPHFIEGKQKPDQSDK